MHTFRHFSGEWSPDPSPCRFPPYPELVLDGAEGTDVEAFSRGTGRLLWKAALTALGMILLLATPAAAQEVQPGTPSHVWPLLASSLAWLVPAGLTLIAAASVPARRGWQTALAGVAAAGLAVSAFFAVGFSVAFGGIGLIDWREGFSGLVWEWSLLGPEWGPKWGMAGLAGWALTGPAATPDALILFFCQLPWVATAALVPLLALRGRTPPLATLLGGLLVGGVLYPLAANWVWGGGWLANLGDTLKLGHGLVDFAGAGPVHLLGGAVALAGLLILVPRRAGRPTNDELASLPTAHLPLLASVGAFLVLAGSLGWSWANPLLDLSRVPVARGAVNSLLAAVGGALLPLGYVWFVTGRPDSLMTAKGMAAGAVAAAAFGPFVPPWAALVLGASAGFLVPVLIYLVTELLRLADETAVVAVHLAGGAVGLLGVGLFADGLAGLGWNGFGQETYLGIAGQGVTGLVVASGSRPDWPGQIQAQAVGLVALFLVPLLAATLLYGPLAVLAQGLRWSLARRQAGPVAEAAQTSDELSLTTLPVGIEGEGGSR